MGASVEAHFLLGSEQLYNQWYSWRSRLLNDNAQIMKAMSASAELAVGAADWVRARGFYEAADGFTLDLRE